MILSKIIGSGIAQILVTFGLLYLIAKLWNFVSLIRADNIKQSNNQSGVRNEHERTELNRLISENEYKCPICGKTEPISKCAECFLPLENSWYTVRYCSSCANQYHKYKDDYRNWTRNKNSDIPDSWLLKIPLFVALEIPVLITYHVYIGSMKFFWGRLFFLPLISWLVVTLSIRLFFKIRWCFKPAPPFSIPSLKHIKKCNAFVS